MKFFYSKTFLAIFFLLIDLGELNALNGNACPGRTVEKRSRLDSKAKDPSKPPKPKPPKPGKPGKPGKPPSQPRPMDILDIILMIFCAVFQIPCHITYTSSEEAFSGEYDEKLPGKPKLEPDLEENGGSGGEITDTNGVQNDGCYDEFNEITPCKTNSDKDYPDMEKRPGPSN